MLKLFNQRCLALHPLKTRLISGFLRPSGFIGDQFAFTSAAAAVKDQICEVEEKFGISWKSTYFPLSPEFSRKVDSDQDLKRDINHVRWGYIDPEYPDELVCSSESPQPGDVSSSSLFGTGGYLVRNNGDRVDVKADTFKGKFVFVCCFHAPPPFDCQRIINVCDELCSSRDDVELVMAAWINTVVDVDDHKQVFDNFFSAFPKSCLAVPFEDSKRRAYVCKLVADYTSSGLGDFPCLVLDTEGIVLPPLERRATSFFGAAAFPFTQEILKDFSARHEQLKKSSSLEQLLLVNTSSPGVVYKFNPEGGPCEEVSISELSDKLVGLYVPGRCADLFPTLQHIYEQCMKKQLEFEIVVAYSEPGSSMCDLHDRKLYQEKIDRLLLQKHDICRQWWCLPLNDSVSTRLDQLIKPYSCNLSSNDRLCVFGPAGAFKDAHAPGLVMKLYGIDGYPFTGETIIQKEVSKKREITLESVLLGDDLFRGTDRDDITCALKLLGRRISVYFGCSYYMWDHEAVVSSYREMKAKDPGFEVVFVYTKNDMISDQLLNQTIFKMPWYVCSFGLDRFETMRENLLMNIVRRGYKYTGDTIVEFQNIARRGYGDFGHAIVGFGEDGRVCSCRQADLATFTLDDTLYKDVSARVYSFTA